MKSKKVGKISSKTRTDIFKASVFDISVHKTERTANQKFVEWINQIIKERNLPLGIAEQETVGADRKQPDIVITINNVNRRALNYIHGA